MKKIYLVPEIEIIVPTDLLMWNGAGKEEGVLTASWEGGYEVTPTPDVDDSERSKWGSLTWRTWSDDIDEIEELEEDL